MGARITVWPLATRVLISNSVSLWIFRNLASGTVGGRIGTISTRNSEYQYVFGESIRRIHSDTRIEAVADLVDQLGYDALKFDHDVPSGHERDRANRYLGTPEINHKEEIVRKVTERGQVAFDCHWAFSAGAARRLSQALEPYDVWWLEDLIPPENHDVQREVTQGTSTPIATGENVYRTHGQRRLLEEQAVDIVTPDVPKVGGMRESMMIATLADIYYVPVAKHNVSSPIGTMASAHVGAAISNALALEYHSHELGWWEDLVEEDGLIQDGRMAVREQPGLGLSLDLDAVERHLAEGQELFDEAYRERCSTGPQRFHCRIYGGWGADCRRSWPDISPGCRRARPLGFGMFENDSLKLDSGTP